MLSAQTGRKAEAGPGPAITVCPLELCARFVSMETAGSRGPGRPGRAQHPGHAGPRGGGGEDLGLSSEARRFPGTLRASSLLGFPGTGRRASTQSPSRTTSQHSKRKGSRKEGSRSAAGPREGGKNRKGNCSDSIREHRGRGPGTGLQGACPGTGGGAGAGAVGSSEDPLDQGPAVSKSAERGACALPELGA